MGTETSSTTAADFFLEALVGIALGSAITWVFVPVDVTGVPVALFIPIVSAVVARGVGRVAGAATAIVGALWFGYLHTEPRFSPVIHARADVILTLATLLVALLSSELAYARKQLKQPRPR
jgi:K+-sensing histidine kinase KdpD